MKFIARLFLVILGLLVTGTGVFLLLATAHPIGALGYYLMRSYEQTALLCVGGALALVGLIPLIIGFSPPKKKPATMLQSGELGEVRITLSALENMVLRVVQQSRWIRDSSRRVRATPQGLVIDLKIKVVADENLPVLTGELQKNVKEYLEEITGIIVSEVQISVQSVVLDQVPLKVK
ncbi:MAG: alkaline shock response membrane anchor protein AmaP [Firmicutes bacterium]|nr:alkaline shock response membrane anchor protein AmaP [Bacillota bacterium]